MPVFLDAVVVARAEAEVAAVADVEVEWWWPHLVLTQRSPEPAVLLPEAAAGPAGLLLARLPQACHAPPREAVAGTARLLVARRRQRSSGGRW